MKMYHMFTQLKVYITVNAWHAHMFVIFFSRKEIKTPTFCILIEFSLTVKAATVIFISGRGSAISSTKQGKSDSIYNLI